MKTKIGTEVGHVTRDSDTTFNVQRSKVNLREAGAYCGGVPHSLFIFGLNSAARVQAGEAYGRNAGRRMAVAERKVRG